MAGIAFYGTVVIIGGIIRYMLGLSQACLYVGKAIAEVDTNTGLQDAVTPPMASNIALTTWAVAIALIGYGFWQFGVTTGAIAIGILILTIIVVGAIAIPQPNSKHFVQMIHHSLVNRVANYAKANDQMRSEAAATLVASIEHRLADKLR
jgi:glucose dehydrogenase